jgi:Xaa-Pro aminopeptidase
MPPPEHESEKITAITKVLRAVEAAAAIVIEYLKITPEPTSEGAHVIIDRVLADFKCESPEGHIVAGGVQSSAPHEKGTGQLKRGEPIVIDIYPRSTASGYFADMSRTVCLGEPSPELEKMYEAVREAQNRALSLVKPGARGGDIQEAVEKYFIEQGFKTSGKREEKGGFPFKEGFVHGVGHGVGLKIHEAPHLGRGSKDVLKEGDVITIEPGLYYEAIGGVRLEDMVLVTKDGYQNLTNFPKELQVK